MSERFKPKEILSDPDVQVNGSFGGLSSASYSSTGNVAYADKLVNCTITARNEIKRRTGSRVLTYTFGLAQDRAEKVSNYSFTFDNIRYIVSKVGQTLFIYSMGAANTYVKGFSRLSVFSVGSTLEKATFSSIVEGNICYVLIATKSTELQVLVLLRRELSTVSILNTTTITGNISNYPTANVVNSGNSFLYQELSKAFINTTTVTQTSSLLNITTPAAHGIVAGIGLFTHLFFVCRGRSASYYPGSYLYNSAVRRNSLPLDVNVEVPADLAANPLSNENDIQTLGQNSLTVWQTQNTQTFTRDFTQTPSTQTSWDFSDGSYTVNASNRTTRTPNYISFGGLSAGGAVERVYMYRNREIVLAQGYLINAANIIAFTDTFASSPSFYNSTLSPDTVNVRYFGFTSTTRPSPSSVVELILTLASAGVTNTVVNLDQNAISIVIGDDYIIPLYGYGGIASVGNFSFPDKILSVGNRVLLAGLDNRIAFSNANWNYRGISWNNFQVSAINFNNTSSYVVALAQQASKVNGLESVNGVVIAATDVGLFRISGESAVLPPNATTANTSRISSEIVNSSDCLLVYENKVFFASNTGLFQLQYSQETEEITPLPLSVDVSNYFSLTPKTIAFSATYRAFLLTFENSKDVLVFSFSSESWSVFKFTFAMLRLDLSKTIDGYYVTIAETGGGSTFASYICAWDSTLTTDLSNANDTLTTGSLAIRADTNLLANSITVVNSSTDISTLSTPAELANLYSAAPVFQTYGDNHVQSVSGANVQIKEEIDGIHPYQILSFFVSKAFASDKLTRSHRVRLINLVVAGSGTIVSALVISNKSETYQIQETQATLINVTNSGLVQANAASDTRVLAGDFVNVGLRFTGVNENWAIAMQITQSILVLAFQFDTSVKKKGRLP